MKKTIKYLALIAFAFSLLNIACKNTKENPKENTVTEKIVPENLKWSERMMLSEIERVPKASMLDFVDKNFDHL